MLQLRFGNLTLPLSDDKLVIFFLIYPRKQDLSFHMQKSIGDSLHEMSNPVFWKNQYFKMLPAENFTQSAKR